MPWDDPDFESNLAQALNSFNWGKAEQISQDIVARIKSEAEPIDERFAKRLLYLLRRKKQFVVMAQLADVMLRSGLNTLQIRRQYAQALIDQGMLTPAEMVLQSIVQDAQKNKTEEMEARGLIGRIYKQLYINNNDPTSPSNRANLERALTVYLFVYRLNPKENWWHGINAVALAARAKRDGFSMTGLPDSVELAKEILVAIQEKDDNSNAPLQDWDVATMVEAYVALGDGAKAARTARTYVESANADAFEIASTLRQFEEVWQLKETEPPGNLLLPILRMGHLAKSGATTSGDPKTLRARANALEGNMKGLEAIFGPDKMQTFKWYKKGLETCSSVARIEHSGKGHGTGWLVKAEDFFPNEKGLLLLTNNHVISESPNPLAIYPDQAQINFQAIEQVLEVEDEVFWYSSYTDLDATFLKLKGEPKAPPLTLSKRMVEMADPPPRMYIIGHPRGRDLELSLQDNYLIALNEKFVHYRTPTEPGNSGSPVFEPEDWRVIALHHKGNELMKRLDGKDGNYEANEGISILELQAETRKPRD
jgi:hypothetical protein